MGTGPGLAKALQNSAQINGLLAAWREIVVQV